jgi:3-oxoacyl-[acyl-carrier-protein] synthase II
MWLAISMCLLQHNTVVIIGWHGHIGCLMCAMRRVAVTGMGIVSPLGNTVDEAYSNAYLGRSGIHLLEIPLNRRLLAPLAATVHFDGVGHFDPPKLRMLDRVSQFALVAANQALVDSGCDLRQLDRDRAGVFVGTGMGGSQSNDDGYKTLYGDASDRIKPFTVLMGMHNAPAAWIGIEHALRGPNLTYSTACSSSAVAIGEAWLRVAGGSLDLAIAGGAEAPLSFGSLKAWEALHTLASIDEDTAVRLLQAVLEEPQRHGAWRGRGDAHT